MAQETKTAAPVETKGLQAARAAAQKYGNTTLTCNWLKTIRKTGGGKVFLFTVSGSAEALAHYKEVMSNVIVKKADGSQGTAYVEDQVTGNPLFFLPTATKPNFKLQWSSGDPERNPTGRFVINDANDAFAQEAKLEDMVLAETAKILAARRFGLVGNVQQQRGTSNQSNTPDMTPEEIEAAMQDAKV